MTKRKTAIRQIARATDIIETGKSVECADGEYRPNWKHEAGRLVFLIAPGTPVIQCKRGCGTRVCFVKGASAYFAVERDNATGHPLTDLYAPKHAPCKPKPVDSALAGLAADDGDDLAATA